MKKNLRNILIAALFVLLFVILAVSSILSKRIKPVPEGTVGNTAGNAHNGGMFCEYNGVVYFANPYDGNALYSMSPDETHMKKLINAHVSNLNAGGNYIFYYQQGVNGSAGLGYLRSVNGLYRASLNGNKPSCLAQDIVFNVQLIGNSLYYLSSDKNGPLFYKISADKKEKELLSKISMDLSCALPDGTAYYNGTQTNHYLYRYNIRNNSSDTVFKGNLWYPVYDNGYIYYLDVANDYRLCRYSLSEDRIEILTHDRVDCFNLGGGYVYYQKNSADEPALKRVTLDGKNEEIVLEGIFTHISVTSKYVYFADFENKIPVYRTPVSGPVSVSTFDAAKALISKDK